MYISLCTCIYILYLHKEYGGVKFSIGGQFLCLCLYQFGLVHLHNLLDNGRVGKGRDVS